MSDAEEVYRLEERSTTDLSNKNFSEDDIEALEQNDKITIKHDFKIRVPQYIGVIGLPSGQLLQVDPKNTLSGFKPLYYLAKAGRISEEIVTGAREIGFSTGESFVDVVGEVFDEELGRLLRTGIQSQYVTHEESTAHVRGQLRISRQLSRQEPLATSFESRFDDLTADIPLNRLLLCATIKLSKNVGDSTLRGRLKRRAGELRRYVTVPATPPSPQEITLTQDTQAYKPLLQLADLVLEDTYVDTFGERTQLLQTVLVNTETLFEEVVFRTVEEIVHGSKYVVGGDGDPENRSDSDIGHLLVKSDGPPLQGLEPDVFLRERGEPVWVADAKWREDNSPKRSNLYQVTAYQRKVATPGVIFYPAQGGTIEDAYELTRPKDMNDWNKEIQFVELPLGADSYDEFQSEIKTAVKSTLEKQLGAV